MSHGTRGSNICATEVVLRLPHDDALHVPTYSNECTHKHTYSPTLSYLQIRGLFTQVKPQTHTFSHTIQTNEHTNTHIHTH